MTLDAKTIDLLSAVTTATITTILLKKGLRNVWMRGTRPLRPGMSTLTISWYFQADCAAAGTAEKPGSQLSIRLAARLARRPWYKTMRTIVKLRTSAAETTCGWCAASGRAPGAQHEHGTVVDYQG